MHTALTHCLPSYTLRIGSLASPARRLGPSAVPSLGHLGSRGHRTCQIPARPGYHRLPRIAHRVAPGSKAAANSAWCRVLPMPGPRIQASAPAGARHILAPQLSSHSCLQFGSQDSGFRVARPAKHSLPHSEAITCAAPSHLHRADTSPAQKKKGEHASHPRARMGQRTCNKALLHVGSGPAASQAHASEEYIQTNSTPAAQASPNLRRFASPEQQPCTQVPQCKCALTWTHSLFLLIIPTSEPPARPGSSSHKHC